MNNTNDKLSNLREQYFKAILATETEDELYTFLPDVAFSNFYDLMRGIIQSLISEIEEYEQFAIEDEESRNYWLIEATKLKEKLSICENVLRNSYVTDEKNQEVDKSQKINIIFGINPAGNVAFLNDLRKNVDSHYYPAVDEMLTSLENGSLTNIEKFTSIDAKLQGLYKAKAYQLRIIFRQLPSNMIYVDMVRVKKDDWSTKDKQEPIKRCSLLNSDYEAVKRRVKNNDRVEELIIENQEIMSQIRERLEKNALGRKNNNG